MPHGKKLGRPAEILLVEDSPSDALLTKVALQHGNVDSRLHHVPDGVEALAYLRKEGPYAGEPQPDVILLDLNLPRMSGREVLEEIRADQQLKRLAVIVLTTSDDERDIQMAYGLNANCYLTKPVDMSQFAATMRALGEFWLTWATLPPAAANASDPTDSRAEA